MWWLPWQVGDGRIALQRVLAPYLGIEVHAARFESGKHGKPRLGVPWQHVHFNWSHCRGIALVAVAHDLELGVDIEHRDRPTQALGIAERWFAQSEIDLLRACEGDARLHAFLSLWTAKEAVLKALGEGLSFGLGRVVVDLHAGNTVLRSVAGCDPAADSWQLTRPPAPVPGLVAALAWQGGGRKLRSFDTTGTRHPDGDLLE